MLYEDPNLTTICQTIMDHLPVKSIIIVGSRARGDHHHSSDYDIILVMRLIQAAVKMKRIKQVQNQLSNELGINLSLNPLTPLQTRKTKGSLFFYKLKREGVTIAGPDHIESLSISSLSDMPLEVFVSFLFSIVEKLVSTTRMGVDNELTPHPDGLNQITISKCILQCGELYLLLRGIYPNGFSDTVRLLDKLSDNASELNAICKDAKEALEVINNTRDGQSKDDSNWFNCRFHILNLTYMLFGLKGEPNTEKLEELTRSYVKSQGFLRIRNLQYFAMFVALRRQFPWKVILTLNHVERIMRIAVFWLMMGLRENQDLDVSAITRSENMLKRIMHFQSHTTNAEEHWLFLRENILDRWRFSETVLGI